MCEHLLLYHRPPARCGLLHQCPQTNRNSSMERAEVLPEILFDEVL
jgi:hypothetical protein